MKPSLGFGSVLLPVFMLVFILSGCSGGGSHSNWGGNTGSSSYSDHKGTILQMTTFAENDPYTTFQYNFAKNNGDGCGITFGCIGFTTGTYSGNILIHYYTILNPNNSLAKYIPALDRIDGEVTATGSKSNDTTGLDNFISDIQNCNDPYFKEAQRYEVDQMFWNPAVTMAVNIGVKYPLTLAFIYDMCVNHGSDGAQRYINQTNAAMGGTPGNGIDERQWLAKCISIRIQAFNNNHWGGVDRCYAYQRILNSGNVDLMTPFNFTCYGDTTVINGNPY